uniref:Uncharacterized protein n=1 Tax=Anopheles coluzzii TaxID=1518534 RepID=A0A8W7PJR3_ANOCL
MALVGKGICGVTGGLHTLASTDGRLLSLFNRRSQLFLWISRNSAVMGGRVTTLPPPTAPLPPPPPPPATLIPPPATATPPPPPPGEGTVELLLPGLSSISGLPDLLHSARLSHTYDHRLSQQKKQR